MNKMAEYKIVYNRKDCIGAFTCGAISPKFWEMDEDGKANLKGARLNEETGFYELSVDEKDYKEALESAQVCPVNVIMVYKVENGSSIRIFPEEESK